METVGMHGWSEAAVDLTVVRDSLCSETGPPAGGAAALLPTGHSATPGNDIPSG